MHAVLTSTNARRAFIIHACLLTVHPSFCTTDLNNHSVNLIAHFLTASAVAADVAGLRNLSAVLLNSAICDILLPLLESSFFRFLTITINVEFYTQTSSDHGF
jgi:hypothetical protein